MLTDRVIARPETGVHRGPDRRADGVGRRVQWKEHALVEELLKGREPAEGRPDQRELAGIDRDQHQPLSRRLGHRGTLPRSSSLPAGESA